MTYVPIKNTILGSIKVLNVPERYQFKSWRDFVRAIPSFLAVEVPAQFSGVITGEAIPPEEARDKIWVVRRANGEVTGIKIFNVGKWGAFYGFAPEQIVEVFGDSGTYETDHPEFKVILSGDSEVPEEVVKDLMSKYVSNGVGGFSKFAVRYAP